MCIRDSPGTLSVTGRAVGRQVPETSGLSPVETEFRSMPKPDRWAYDMSTVCKLHQDAISQLQAYTKKLLDSQASANPSPNRLLEMHYAAALVESYQGHMDEAIKHCEACYRIAQTDLPDRVPLIEEVLGDVHLHKAEMDNGVYTQPGDRCIFPPQPNGRYSKFQKTHDVDKAIGYFLKYLETKPDDLEVKWILNLAYMTPVSYTHLDVYKRQGHYSGAVNAYRVDAQAELICNLLIRFAFTINCNTSSSRALRSRRATLSPAFWKSCGAKTRSPAATRRIAIPRSRSTASLRMYPRAPASIAWRTRAFSECMLSIRTAISGHACKILLVATKPFMLGITRCV